MMTRYPFKLYLTRKANVSAGIYIALVVTLVACVFSALTDIGKRYRSLNASIEILARLEERTSSEAAASNRVAGLESAESSLLEGQSMTVASASLLQRVTRAISRVGGNVVSSEFEGNAAQSKNGYVKVIATCEIEQSALQQLLYDLEAGMPLLFIDQLTAQVSTPVTEGAPLRVQLGVSGMWQAAQK
jgi:general secretion pathway protein M